MLDNFRESQKQKISDNYHAYCYNFGEPFIYYDKLCKGFYVFLTESNFKEFTNWVCYCPTIDFLDGWLWGAVQANCKRIKPINKD